MIGSRPRSLIRGSNLTDMKLTYQYIVHGFSGGRMLSNTVSGEWVSFGVGTELDSPNREVKLTVTQITSDTVTIHAKYRTNEKTMSVSLSNEETFGDEANAYGFSYVFTVKE